jgi:DNA-binding transcriptional LysR family regulator
MPQLSGARALLRDCCLAPSGVLTRVLAEHAGTRAQAKRQSNVAPVNLTRPSYRASSERLGLVPPGNGLDFNRLLDDPFVVALPATSPLARRKLLHAADLDPEGLITYPKDPQSRFAEHTISLLRSTGNQSPVAYEASDIHTALGMVASHLGFCLVGRSVQFGSRRDLAFVPMPALVDKAAVFAVTKTGEKSKIAAAFVETLVATTSQATPARTAVAAGPGVRRSVRSSRRN